MGTRPDAQRLHLDTDFAGDPDDACALTMLLGWPGVEVVGITTTADPDGQRAGYVAELLALLGRTDVAVASGAGVSSTTGRPMGAIPDHTRFWGTPEMPPPLLSRAGAASDLLDESIKVGATIAAIGPFTNLSTLENARTGRLGDAKVVVMGGWLDSLSEEFPPWGPSRDWNIVCDRDAAEIVAASSGDLTWATIPGTIKAQLREQDLGRLRASGEVGELLARQSRAHGDDNRLTELAERHDGLHPDLVNFHWDPVACAAALGWPGAEVCDARVSLERSRDSMRLTRSAGGRIDHVVVDVDGGAFTEHWLTCVESAQSP